MKAIDLNNIWEKYRIKFVKDGRVSWEEIWALEDINLNVGQGQVVGIIGENGAGKTTLLKLIAGMLMPDRGKVDISGRVSALMELGAGFNPEFTGRENITLNARVYGLSEDSLIQQIERIVDFAGLGKFIDAPIKYYSQGMCMRLAFALAIFVEPDILLIDDILAVGDEEAQHRCLGKISEFHKAGKTIILVSHNMGMVSELCDRVVLLEKGKVICDGPAQEVIAHYLKRVKGKEEITGNRVDSYPQRVISSGRLRLFADLENKSLDLYYKDIKISSGRGLDSPFCISGEWFSLSQAEWRIKKVSDDELVLSAYFHLLALSQIWTLICKDENTLGIKIEIESGGQVCLTNQDARLEVSDQYKKWETVYEEGGFPSGQYINNMIPVRLKDNKVFQATLRQEPDRHLPCLFFEVSSRADRQVLGIYKYREGLKEHACFNFSQIITRQETLIKPGRHPYFEGRVILDKEKGFQREDASANIIELNGGSLRFVFDRGKGRIFFRDMELTSGLGMYTSLRSSGIWRDSSQAIWRLIRQEDSKIVLHGDWPYIPVSQVFQLEVAGGDSLLWKVDMEVHEEVDLEIVQANLMLSAEYGRWSISGICESDFLDEYARDYDTAPFRFWYGRSDRIRAATPATTLPSVLFRCAMKDDHFRAVVENTDYLYRARLLQYQRGGGVRLSPAKYPYFEGIIEIGTKG